MPPVTLHMLAGPSDLPWMALLLNHVKSVHGDDIQETILTIDTEPSKRFPAKHPLLHKLEAIAEELLKAHVVDIVISLGNQHDTLALLAPKHFGRKSILSRDHRGIPMWGWIMGIEHSRCPYVFHVDSDILFHQEVGKSWIQAAIEVIESDQNALFVAPWPGPPHPKGLLLGQAVSPTRGDDGCLHFPTFSSRRYLVKKERFQSILPLPIGYAGRKAQMLMKLGGPSALLPWESLVSAAMERTQLRRVHLSPTYGWTLHCPDHSQPWQNTLPRLIQLVQDGIHPEGQQGHYDLSLEEWNAL